MLFLFVFVLLLLLLFWGEGYEIGSLCLLVKELLSVIFWCVRLLFCAVSAMCSNVV